MKRQYLATAIATCLAAPAAAQLEQEYPDFEPGQALKNGYSSEELKDADVHDSEGNKIAEVEDVIIAADGNLQRLVVAVNEGLFGTGGRRLAVDWQDVRVGDRDGYDIEHLVVDVAEGNLEEGGLFKDSKDAIRGGPNEWRAGELVGDDVDLEGSVDDGYVSDVMFDSGGELRAIAATADLSGSTINFYAPYSDKGWEPGDDFYVVPYSEEELRELLPEDAA